MSCLYSTAVTSQSVHNLRLPPIPEYKSPLPQIDLPELDYIANKIYSYLVWCRDIVGIHPKRIEEFQQLDFKLIRKILQT